MNNAIHRNPGTKARLVKSRWGQVIRTFLVFLLSLGTMGLAVAQTATTTTLTLSRSSAYAGQTFTITANVTGSSPTGAVTVYDGAQALFYFNLSAGTANYTYSFTAVGPHNLTASYAGNSTNAASTSAPVTLTIYTRPPTTTSVTASPTAAYLGQTINFTGTVTGSVNPTGVIRFYNYSTQVAQGTVNASGVATATYVINTTYPQMSLSAGYAGDDANAPSTSAAIPGTMSLAPVTSQLTCPASSPVATAIACTVTVTSPSIYASLGSATVTLNGSTVGTTTLSYVSSNPTTYRGTVNLPANAAPANVTGNHSLVVQTAANSQTQASTSPVTVLVVAPRTSTTTLSSTPTTAGATQVVTLTANVTNGLTPGGTITFRDGSTTLGTAPLSGTQASLNTSFTTTGSHSLSATYNGDTNNTTSTSAALTQTVTPTAATTTALVVSPTSITAGSNTTLTATITGSSPSGTVVFREGTTVLGQTTVSSGQASLSVPFAIVGAHSLTANYWGDTTNGASTSTARTLTVTSRPTTTTLASTLARANQSQPIPLTATISGANPTGTVTFREGSTTLGTAPVANGAATFNASFTVLGAHTITSSYGGDTNNAASNSGSVAVQILPGPVPPVAAAPVVNYEYDAKGNPTKTIVAPGVAGYNFTTQASYDALSRVKDTTDPKNGVTRFQYDGADRTTQVTDPRNLVTQYPRNGLGDATQLISPDTGTASHTYDAAGNLKTRTDSRGVLSTHTYDALNRLTRTVYSKTGMTSQTYVWNYDQTGSAYAYGIGRLTSTTHPSGSTTYKYDEQGRLTSDVQRVTAATGANTSQIGKTVTYTYDAAGNTTSILYPSGRKLTLTYTNGQLTGMGLGANASAAPTPLISGLSFEPFGGPKSWNWQLGASTQAYERSYDTSGRLVRYRLGNSLRDLSYDAADRITGYTHYDATTGVAQPSLNQSFGYDENGRLTTITTATASWTLTYDANGNRTGVTLNGTPSVYATEATSNRLTSTTNPARNFGYDPAGNTTSDSTNYTSTYDAAGRLQTLTKAGVTSTYSYNGLGQRVRKYSSTGASSTNIFVYDQQGQLLGEYGSTGTPIREYVWLGSTPVAMFTPPPSGSTPVVYYFHTDHLNTPRVVTDTANNIRWRWMAEPFGTTAPENNPSNLGALTQNLRFPGQYADSESGLFYNYFRNYDSTIGRYTQSDPIGLDGGINTYAYVGGNPISGFDPNGLFDAGNIGQTTRILVPVAGAIGTGLATVTAPAWVVPVAVGAAVVGGGVGLYYYLRPDGSPQAGPAPDGSPVAAPAPASPAGAPVGKPALPDVCPDDLCEQLALAEAKAGAGVPIMGQLGDEPRLVAHYGRGPWRKMEHKHFCADGRQLVIHYFTNGRGLNVELKFKKR